MVMNDSIPTPTPTTINKSNKLNYMFATKNPNVKVTSTPVSVNSITTPTNINIYPPVQNIKNPSINTDVIDSSNNEIKLSYMFDINILEGKGRYYIISSSENGFIHTDKLLYGAAWHAFDGKSNTYWKAVKTTNKPTTYSKDMSNNTIVGIPGEWIQMVSPVAFCLYYYTVYYGMVNNPKKWTLVGAQSSSVNDIKKKNGSCSSLNDIKNGSATETIWEILDRRDYSGYSNSSTNNIFKLTISNPSKKYNSFRFIYEESYNDFCLYNIAFYGKPTVPSLKNPNESEQAYNYYNNYTSYGNLAPSSINKSIVATNVNNLDDCYNTCDLSNNDCSAFTYDANQNQCKLYSSVDGSLEPSTSSTFIKNNGYQRLNSYAIGNAYGKKINIDATLSSRNSNEYQCRKICDDTTDCVAYEVDNLGKSCMIYSGYASSSNLITSSNNKNVFMKTYSADNYLCNIYLLPCTQKNVDTNGNIMQTIDVSSSSMKDITNNGTMMILDPLGSLNYVYSFDGNCFMQLNIPTPIVNTRSFWIYSSEPDSDGGHVFSSTKYPIFFNGTQNLNYSLNFKYETVTSSPSTTTTNPSTTTTKPSTTTTKPSTTTTNPSTTTTNPSTTTTNPSTTTTNPSTTTTNPSTTMTALPTPGLPKLINSSTVNQTSKNSYIYTVKKPQSVAPNNWQHYTFVSDGTSVKVYINGQFDNENTSYFLTSPDSSVIQFGAYKSDKDPMFENTHFYGCMYGMAMYPYALSSSQVGALYNSQIIHYIYESSHVTPTNPQKTTNNLNIRPLRNCMQLNWNISAISSDGIIIMGITKTDDIFVTINSGNEWYEINTINENDITPTNVTSCAIYTGKNAFVIATTTGIFVRNYSIKAGGRVAFNQYVQLSPLSIDKMSVSDDGLLVAISNTTKKIYTYSLNDNINQIVDMQSIEFPKITYKYSEYKVTNSNYTAESNPESISDIQSISVSNSIVNSESTTVRYNIVLCGSKNKRGYAFLSKDKGVTWTQIAMHITNFDYLPKYMCSITNNGQCIVIASTYLYLSTDEGNTWRMNCNSASVDEFNLGQKYKYIGISSQNGTNETGNVIVAYDETNSIYLSNDYANSWYVSNISNPSVNSPLNISSMSISKNGKKFICGIDNEAIYQCDTIPVAPLASISTSPPIIGSGTINISGTESPSGTGTGSGTGSSISENIPTTPAISTVVPTTKIPRHIPQQESSLHKNMPVENKKDLIFNQLLDSKNKSSTYNKFKSEQPIKESFESNMKSAIDLPIPPLDEYHLDSSNKFTDSSGNKYDKNEDFKQKLMDEIKIKLNLYPELHDALPETAETKFFNLNKGNNIVFNLKNETIPVVFDFAVLEQEGVDEYTGDMGQEEGYFQTGMKTNKYPNQNLMGLLELAKANTQTTVDGETRYNLGNVTTYVCNQPHAYRDCETTKINDQYKCVCSDSEKIGDGKHYHTHCEEDVEGTGIYNLLSKFDNIYLKGERPEDDSDGGDAGTLYDPKTNDLIVLIADYYISLLKNKQKYEKLEKLKQISQNTSQFHTDSNYQYKSKFIEVTNLSVGILLLLGSVFGLSKMK